MRQVPPLPLPPLPRVKLCACAPAEHTVLEWAYELLYNIVVERCVLVFVLCLSAFFPDGALSLEEAYGGWKSGHEGVLFSIAGNEM